MKVQALDIFTNKLTLIADSSLNTKLSDLVVKLESSDNIDGFLSNCHRNGDVYSVRLGSYRLFFTIINNDLYFVDVIDPVQVFRGANKKNPRFNSIVNPRINSRINPTINSRINPTINSRINPLINSRLNPGINSKLNPRINTQINPQINNQINPNFNHTLNPHINTRINPKINTALDSKFVFDVDTMQCLFYCVEVPNNGKIIMIYDFQQATAVFWGVKRDTGYCIFSFVNNENVGFWESNGVDGFNWFDNGLNWKYFVV